MATITGNGVLSQEDNSGVAGAYPREAFMGPRTRGNTTQLISLRLNSRHPGHTFKISRSDSCVGVSEFVGRF
jgi:hypothetical protein